MANRKKVALIKDLETHKAGEIIQVWYYVAAQLAKSGHIKPETSSTEKAAEKAADAVESPQKVKQNAHDRTS